MIQYFASCHTLEELKSTYKRLAKQLHPDCGGTDAEMAALNDQYDRLSATLPKTAPSGETYQPETREAPEEFRAAVVAVMNMSVVELELCGSWLWATGNTYPYKDALKAAGYHWSKNKQAWYWHEAGYAKHGKKSFTLDQIRDMHGSEKISAAQHAPLPA